VPTAVGTPLPPGVTLDKVLAEGAVQSGYWQHGDQWQRRADGQQPANPARRRGVGMAMGFKNVGFSLVRPNQNWATVELYGTAEIERVVVRQAGAGRGPGRAHRVYPDGGGSGRRAGRKS